MRNVLPLARRAQDFPPYICVRDLGVSPFYIEGGWDTPAPQTVCLTVRTKTPSVYSRLCSSMDFSKLELDIRE